MDAPHTGLLVHRLDVLLATLRHPARHGADGSYRHVVLPRLVRLLLLDLGRLSLAGMSLARDLPSPESRMSRTAAAARRGLVDSTY